MASLYRESKGLKAVMRDSAQVIERKVWSLLRKVSKIRLFTKRVRLDLTGSESNTTEAGLVGAIWIGGGIGDHAVATRFVRDIVRISEPLSLDVYSGEPNHSSWLFGCIDGYRSSYRDSGFQKKSRRYDFVLRLDQAVSLEIDEARWFKLRRYPKIYRIFENIDRYRSKIEVFIASPSVLADGLARHASFEGASRRDFLHKIAGISYGGDRLELGMDKTAVGRFGLSNRMYLTVNTGFDENMICSTKRATKSYPHFGKVLARIKARCPELLSVQIGTPTGERLSETDVDLVGKTNLREAAGILRHAVIHLDGEGGLVHLASCLGVPSCVIFGPTPAKYFAYPENLNVEPGFCGGCWWVTDTWMDRCPRGYSTARCMTDQEPLAVADAIYEFLSNKSTCFVNSRRDRILD